MNSKFTIKLILGLAILLLVSGCTQAQNTQEQNTDIDNPDIPDEDSTGNVMEDDSSDTGNTITYTAEGYSPSPLTITVGESVTWVNNSNKDMWPATAQHPSHTVYPGSDIQKCGSAEEANLFDACRGISPEGEYTFTFTEAGEWFYHDHLTPGKFGQIIVEE
tara:strand:+ start:21744 stop:22229 length:486 start_codon:yes stop_codon:yes gene_type:complete